MTAFAASLLFAAVVLSAGFCLHYAARSQWRATAPGRALMYLNLALCAGATNELALHAFGPYPNHGAVRVLMLAAICSALFRQVMALREALK